MSKVLIGLGIFFLIFGIYLSATSNLFGAVGEGLNGATENALIFDIIGAVLLVVGIASRK